MFALNEGIGTTAALKERSEKYQKLFHYTSAEGILGIFGNESLWATQIQYMNDSKEFQHSLDIAIHLIEKKKYSASEHLIKFFEALELTLKTSNGARTFIFSMTENPDQLSQWRGYCGLGGYSIGFDLPTLQEIAKKQNFRLVKCIYDDAKKVELIEVEIEKAVQFFSQNKHRSDYSKIVHESKFYGAMLNVGSIMKHSSFAEENEWRLIGGPFSCKLPMSGWRPKNGVLLPYYQIELDRDTEGFLPISEIYIGPCNDKKLSENALDMYLRGTNNDTRLHYSQTPLRD
jgi:hypothetical protein